MPCGKLCTLRFMPKQSDKAANKPQYNPASEQRSAGESQVAAESDAMIEDRREVPPAQARVQRIANSASSYQIGTAPSQLASQSANIQREQVTQARAAADNVALKINGKQAQKVDYQHPILQSATATAQRALIVGSHNEKYDIEDMGLWWTMACEHKNAQHEGFEAVILTLKDFDRDEDQEFVISVNDKIRFITHGMEGGEAVVNEKEGGGYDVEEWADIEAKILAQIEVFNAEQEKIATESLLKPYFCFMKENEGLMDAYHGELADIGEGPVLLTNKFVLALDMAKMEDAETMGRLAAGIRGNASLSQLFTEQAGWRPFSDVAAHLPLLNDFKTKKEASEVNPAEMYDEIYAFVEPRYQGLVDLVGELITGAKSARAPWENLRQQIDASVADKEVVDDH